MWKICGVSKAEPVLFAHYVDDDYQPTWRLWGEERVDGAVYTVYLKKVRYHRPTRSASSLMNTLLRRRAAAENLNLEVSFSVRKTLGYRAESDDEISHLEWETVRVRFVKAGTVERLVEALATDDGELESTYVNVFLATYRTADFKLSSLRVLDRGVTEVSDIQGGAERHERWRWAGRGGGGVCLAPGMRLSAHHTSSYRLPHVPHRHFAEQLTRMDMELVESHMPVTNHLAILLDGQIYDIDSVDRFVERYGQRGYTVVVHLKDELDVRPMFSRYFKMFIVNDTADVLANVQVLDPLNYAQIFSTMEQLLKDHSQVYSYIISAIPMDYIYNKILTQSTGCAPTSHSVFPWWTYCCMRKAKKRRPSYITLGRLEKFDKKYDITTLKELPCSPVRVQTLRSARSGRWASDWD
ncbi:hypothetical protein MSG28_002373 [Choristoneura fumiferana]|uniref:Uncharacterized protein n=1 Tax=Choristoneura fumiferana TaxID=7141 RepID=A0ACC0JW27_CHOFU|nr:hypothetical protein MSG28_002373 [Choristoneura fumiferana]